MTINDLSDSSVDICIDNKDSRMDENRELWVNLIFRRDMSSVSYTAHLYCFEIQTDFYSEC